MSDLIGCCGGYHRKPYIFIANLTGFVISMFLMYRGDTIYMDKKVFIMMLIGINISWAFMDVNYDACIVENIRDKQENKRSTYFNYIQYIRLTGSLVGNTLGPYLWDLVDSRGIFLINSIIFLVGGLLAIFFTDYPRSNILSNFNTPNFQDVDIAIQGSDQFSSIIEQDVNGKTIKETKKRNERLTLCYLLKITKNVLNLREIKTILCYNFITGLFPGTGLVMFYYLVNKLGCPPSVFSIYGILTVVARLLATTIYTRFCMGFNMKKMFLKLQVVSFLNSIITVCISISIIKYTFPVVEYEVMTTLVQSSDSYYIPTTSNLFLFLHEKSSMNYTELGPLIERIGVPTYWAYGFYLVGAAITSNIKFYPMIYITSISCERAVEGSVMSVILSIISISYGIKYFTESVIMKNLGITLDNFDKIYIIALLACFCEFIGFFVIYFLIPAKSTKQIEEDFIKEKESLILANSEESLQTLNNNNNNNEDEVVL